MSRVFPYHTTIPEEYPPSHRDVYHDRDDCHYGREILREHRTEGPGKRPRCSRCVELSVTAPYHTTSEEYSPHRNVYHDHNDCPYGMEILPEHRQAGKGGRPRCSRCAEESRVLPYHTTTDEDYPPTHRDVYHDHDDCHYGQDIKPEHREEGDGGRPRCSFCTELG